MKPPSEYAKDVRDLIGIIGGDPNVPTHDHIVDHMDRDFTVEQAAVTEVTKQIKRRERMMRNIQLN